MNAFVQALVWTMLTGFLYAAWQHTQSVAAGDSVSLARHLGRVFNALRSLAILIGASLTIAVIALLLPAWFQSASAAPRLCPPPLSQTLSASGADSSIITLCGPIEIAPSTIYGEWRADGHAFSVTAETELDLPDAVVVPGQRLRADLVRGDHDLWRATRLQVLPEY